MKFLSPGVATAFSFSYLQAAVISTPDLVSTLVSTTPGDTTDNDPDPLVDFKDLINNSDRGDVISSASGLVLDIPKPDDFLVTADSLSSFVNRTASQGSPIEASSFSSYAISFSLATGESGLLSLSFSHILQDLGVDSTITWSLAGPDPNILSLSGDFSTITGAASQSGTTNQSVNLTTEGSYTFTITTEVPQQSIPSIRSGLASISNFSLEYDAMIPEPSTLFLAGLAGTLGLIRRRRTTIPC